jgi:hypothetical protein
MIHLTNIQELKQNKAVFKTLLMGVSEKECRWKPTPDKWCLLEIVCHLFDEEREDFRARVRSTLEDASNEWPMIDPPAWVSERNYMGQDYNEKLIAFLEERAVSLTWLDGLQSPNWNATYAHPKVGPVPAIRLLSNWVAHDYLHLRQIIRLKYEYLEAFCNEPLDYAGKW